MCLWKISPEVPKEKGFGYKVVRKVRKRYFSAIKDFPFKTGWNKKTTELPIETDCDGYYHSGFHVFKLLKDARREKEGFIGIACVHRIVKVQYRKAHTQGDQDGIVIVADEIKILKEVR